MAIVKTGDMYGQVGRLGQNVYYTAYSETRSRKLAASVSNPRTQAQMLQRVRWANLVNFYRVNKEWMKYAFETKKKNQSEYNKFMSLNVASSPIYLTKQEAGAGACVVYPYLITQGSLPSIEQEVRSNAITTNIYVSDVNVVAAGASVADFSDDLVINNPALRYGDQLSVIRLYQQVNQNTGTPYIILRKYEIVLSSTNQKTLQEYLPMDIIGTSQVGGNNVISISTTGRVGGISFVLSRTTGGRTFVSTQRLVCVGVDSLVTSYSSLNHLQSAIDSYGENQEAFLSSSYAKGIENADVPITPLLVNTSFGNFNTGQQFIIPSEATTTEDIDLIFTGPVPTAENVSGVISMYGGGTVVLSSGQTGGNLVSFSDVNLASSAGSQVEYIQVAINGVTYRFDFLVIVRNEDTIQGLE